MGELASSQFVLFSDVPSYRATSLTLSPTGIPTLGSSARPRVGQVGDTGSLIGLTNVIEADIASFDMGADAYDNGTQLGRNAILMQSSGVSGDILDLALVFDVDDLFEGISAAFVITNPDAGSFTFDSAIAAVDAVPEPSGLMLLACGLMWLWSSRPSAL